MTDTAECFLHGPFDPALRRCPTCHPAVSAPELPHLLAEGAAPWEFVQDDADSRLDEARVLNSRSELVFRGRPCDAALAVAVVNKVLTLTALTDEERLPTCCAGEGYPGIAHDLNEARRAESRAVERSLMAEERVRELEAALADCNRRAEEGE